jgi:hypothetical protein
MHPQWHRLIESKLRDHDAGVVLDAMQRYLQFDTFAGVIPDDAIDLIFGPQRLELLAEQAVTFLQRYRDTLNTLPQKNREAALRAHLAGIINLPVPSSDLWHDAFKTLHERNRSYYAEQSTAGKVEMLLRDHEDADVLAAAVSKHLSDHDTPFESRDLVTISLQAIRFYRQHRDRLQRYSLKEQRAIVAEHLAGRSEIAW